MKPEQLRKLIDSGRKAFEQKYEADKPKLAQLGLVDLTLEEYLIFERVTEMLTGAFLEFLQTGLTPKKERADAAPAAG